MKTRTITVHIRAEPELHEGLLYAMNSNTDYEGWHVMQYQESLDAELQPVGKFLLREKEAGE